MRIIKYLFISIAILLCGCVSQQKILVEAPYGLPFATASAPRGTTLAYKGFYVSYNTNNKTPNWVCYSLTDRETQGDYSRKGKQFRPDPNLALPQADNNDYRNSGWSRGHMAPAADFKWDENALDDTFYFTNCCPQDEKLNSGQWNTLEKKAREWAKKYGEVTIVTGPIYQKRTYGTIGKNKVAVPDAFFKALLVFSENGAQAIAFVMNNSKQNENMQRCALSIDELEIITGYDFFPNLDDSIEKTIEASFSLKAWGL